MRDQSRSLTEYYREIADLEPLSREEQRRLAERAQEGDEDARKRLVETNARFVLNYAQRYTNHGTDYEDLVAAGNVGLLEAVDRFEPDRGIKFISYAVHWVRNEIHKVVQQERSPATITQNAGMSFIQIEEAEHELQQEGQPVTAEAVAERADVTEREVRRKWSVSGARIKLDAPQRNDDGPHSQLQGECFTDESAHETPAPDVDLTEIFTPLSDRESFILALYYGVNCEEHTLAGVGKRLDLSRERIRQLRDRAKRKVREYVQSTKASPEWDWLRDSVGDGEGGKDGLDHASTAHQDDDERSANNLYEGTSP